MFPYVLRKTRDGRLVYTLAIWMRVFCLIFSLVLMLGMVSAVMEAGFSLSYLVPLTLALFSFLICFYRDDWSFDSRLGQAVGIFGIGPFVKREVHRFDEIHMIAIRHFHKGIPEGSTAIRPSWRHKEMSSLRLVMDDETGRHVNIEVVPAKRHGLRLETMANAIAGYTQLPLDIDKQALERGLRR